MKLALLGDIHGNDLALNAVLAAASLANVETLLITGDLVGYYDAPRKVMELLQPWDKYVVRGNHEEMLAIARSDSEFLKRVEKKYGTGLRTAIDELTSQQIDELCNLPHPVDLMISEIRILLCHGAPWDVDLYVYPDAAPELFQRCADQNFDIVVMGHTHYPMCQKIGRTLLVNPGSVGQPRNRKPGAHWALFDTVSREISLHCESYDASTLIADAKHRNPALPYLANVLERR